MSVAGTSQTKCTSKNPDTIFNGTNYEDWRQRTFTSIAKEGAKLTLVQNSLEAAYRAATPIGQMTQFAEYDRLQDIARGIITERLRNTDYHLVRECKSAMHMLEILDTRYLVVNDVGAVAARLKLQRLTYDGKSDFRKFLHLFEMRAEEAIRAGNVIPERDLIYQLTTALGPEFVPTLRTMRTEPENQQTFDLYRERVLEHYEITKLFAMRPKKLIIHRRKHPQLRRKVSPAHDVSHATVTDTKGQTVHRQRNRSR